MKSLTTIFSSVAFMLSASGAMAQAERFEGIWQNEDDPNSYYSLHIEGDKVVLVDLASLERTGETLASSFIGTIGTFPPTGAPMAAVEALDPHPYGQRSAEIFVDGDGLRIYWCNQEPGTCILGLLSHIRKVF